MQQQSLSENGESQLEAKIKILEETKSDLEMKVEELENQMLQLEEVCVSDNEQLIILQ